MPAPDVRVTYRLFGLSLASDFPFTCVLPTTTGPADLSFTCQLTPPQHLDRLPSSPAYRHPYRNAEGESLFTWYRLNDYDVLRFTGVADFYLWPKRIVCQVLDFGLNYQVELYFLGPVLAFWLERQGVAVLHAASVVVANRAVAFLAGSRTGKSSLTATFMQAGYPLLTDDILPIRMQGQCCMGQPGYPHMRLWPEQVASFIGRAQQFEQVHPDYTKQRVPIKALGAFCDQPQPVTAVYLLERRGPSAQEMTIDILPLSPAKALFALIRNSSATAALNAVANQQHRISVLTPLLQHLAVRRLVYPSGYAYLPAVRQAILDDLVGSS